MLDRCQCLQTGGSFCFVLCMELVVLKIVVSLFNYNVPLYIIEEGLRKSAYIGIKC